MKFTWCASNSLWLLAIASLAAPTSSSEAATSEDAAIEFYGVETTVSSRLATTVVTIDFSNPNQKCSLIHGMSLQLPRDARVTSLTTSRSDGCSLESVVSSVQDAQDDFDAQVGAGKPAAIVTAWDSENYGVSISLPPDGSARLVLRMEELLHRRDYRISFQIPSHPAVPVKELSISVDIQENETGGAKDLQSTFDGFSGLFTIDTQNSGISARFDASDTDESVLPRLLRLSYDTDSLPEEGILVLSGNCAQHIFSPQPFLSGALPRAMVFVIDVSGSMSGSKLEDAKAAFSEIVRNYVTEQDIIVVHAFSNSGKDLAFGPVAGDENGRNLAIGFVQELYTIGGTNLYGAYIDAIETVRDLIRPITTSQVANSVENLPLIIILTDGRASGYITDTAQIVNDVRAANMEVGSKIFALAFGDFADIGLLTAVSLTNSGKATKVFEGFGDSKQQIETFFRSELGQVFLSDISVSFSSDLSGELGTIDRPILSGGSEVMVWKDEIPSDEAIVVKTTARSLSGEFSSLLPVDDAFIANDSNSNGPTQCVRGFAHELLSELSGWLLVTRNYPQLDEVFAPLIPISIEDGQGNLFSQVKKRAIEVAVSAGIVWPSLTALVTTDVGGCSNVLEPAENVAQQCYSGEGFDKSDDTSDGMFTGQSSGFLLPEILLAVTIALLSSFVLIF